MGHEALANSVRAASAILFRNEHAGQANLVGGHAGHVLSCAVTCCSVLLCVVTCPLCLCLCLSLCRALSLSLVLSPSSSPSSLPACRLPYLPLSRNHVAVLHDSRSRGGHVVVTLWSRGGHRGGEHGLAGGTPLRPRSEHRLCKRHGRDPCPPTRPRYCAPVLSYVCVPTPARYR